MSAIKHRAKCTYWDLHVVNRSRKTFLRASFEPKTPPQRHTYFPSYLHSLPSRHRSLCSERVHLARTSSRLVGIDSSGNPSLATLCHWGSFPGRLGVTLTPDLKIHPSTTNISSCLCAELFEEIYIAIFIIQQISSSLDQGMSCHQLETHHDLNSVNTLKMFACAHYKTVV